MTERLIEKIESFNASRIPEIRSLKYAAMAENPYRFFRATNHLSVEAVAQEQFLANSPNAWLCGDLHLENFGTFRSDNRLVYFDLNDFDDAVLGPVLWEISRFLTSIFIGFVTLKVEERRATRMAQLFLKTYLDTLIKGKAITIETRNATGIIGDFLAKVTARKQSHLLRKRTREHKNKLEILLDTQKHMDLDEERKRQIQKHVQHWLKHDARSPYNYKVTDAVFRLAGTSSLGLHRYVILLKSSNDNGEKYMLMDMKESVPSSMQSRLHIKQPEWPGESERIIAIQQRMQDRCPALLSACNFEGRSFLMQEMQPEEDNINFSLLCERYKDMCVAIDNMAMLTASAQLRSSGRQGSATADTLKEWAENFMDQDRLIRYCLDYSQTIKEDYKYYCTQYASKIIH